ncbi:hypothetical protein MNV49_002148 [Pseudohyphozyma bogoriensis]|nr:hypothetical protein MNV49_002148 [Pseudohyphozyma bogoriensis]
MQQPGEDSSDEWEDEAHGAQRRAMRPRFNFKDYIPTPSPPNERDTQTTALIKRVKTRLTAWHNGVVAFDRLTAEQRARAPLPWVMRKILDGCVVFCVMFVGVLLEEAVMMLRHLWDSVYAVPCSIRWLLRRYANDDQEYDLTFAISKGVLSLVVLILKVILFYFFFRLMGFVSLSLVPVLYRCARFVLLLPFRCLFLPIYILLAIKKWVSEPLEANFGKGNTTDWVPGGCLNPCHVTLLRSQTQVHRLDGTTETRDVSDRLTLAFLSAIVLVLAFLPIVYIHRLLFSLKQFVNAPKTLSAAVLVSKPASTLNGSEAVRATTAVIEASVKGEAPLQTSNVGLV